VRRREAVEGGKAVRGPKRLTGVPTGSVRRPPARDATRCEARRYKGLRPGRYLVYDPRSGGPWVGGWKGVIARQAGKANVLGHGSDFRHKTDRAVFLPT